MSRDSHLLQMKGFVDGVLKELDVRSKDSMGGQREFSRTKLARRMGAFFKEQLGENRAQISLALRESVNERIDELSCWRAEVQNLRSRYATESNALILSHHELRRQIKCTKEELKRRGRTPDTPPCRNRELIVPPLFNNLGRLKKESSDLRPIVDECKGEMSYLFKMGKIQMKKRVALFVQSISRPGNEQIDELKERLVEIEAFHATKHAEFVSVCASLGLRKTDISNDELLNKRIEHALSESVRGVVPASTLSTVGILESDWDKQGLIAQRISQHIQSKLNKTIAKREGELKKEQAKLDRLKQQVMYTTETILGNLNSTSGIE